MVGKEQLSGQDAKESLQNKEVSKEQLESINNNLEKQSKHAEKNTEGSLEKARKSVESEAVSGKETRLKSGEKEGPKYSVTKAEKTRSYKSTMSGVQAQLPTLSKGFSKFIHNPAIEKTSEALSNTVARPSGILGAGLFGFLGFVLVLYFANRNGFAINQDTSLVIILLASGWAVGLIFELIAKAFRKSRKLK